MLVYETSDATLMRAREALKRQVFLQFQVYNGVNKIGAARHVGRCMRE